MSMTIFFINLIFLIFIPFIMLGIIKKTKAFWGGRKGSSIFQPIYDFIKLLKKESVISKDTTIIFKIAPTILLVATFSSALFVPMLKGISIFNVDCAFIIFSYILGLGKFFSIISAMDTGSSFEGMGASREACFSTFVEPAFFILLGSVCIFAKCMDFSSFSVISEYFNTYSTLIIILAVVGLFIMLLIECCRVPVDDPTTHLELTMIHEVMILDNSGIDLAMITWASVIKMFLYSTLIINLVLPVDLSLSILLYLVLAVVISFIIGTVESAMARLRMMHVFEFVFIMTPIALVILAIVAIKMYGGTI